MNLAKDLIKMKNITTEAIRHGIKYEERAKSMYEDQYNTVVAKAGLFIHNYDKYLGASPDGLVGTDGLIEIKCPFTARYNEPNEVNADFVYSDGKLKRTHNYYFQIQGALEVTDRKWCDLVVFTFKGLHVERVQRDRRFWKNVQPKLKVLHELHGTRNS